MSIEIGKRYLTKPESRLFMGDSIIEVVAIKGRRIGYIYIGKMDEFGLVEGTYSQDKNEFYDGTVELTELIKALI